MTETLSFDSLPKQVNELSKQLEAIERLLLEKKTEQPEADELLTVEQCADFLQLSKPTIYGLISKGSIPVMKRSKRCYFSKVELMDYLKAGRKKSNAQIEEEAEKYLSNNKKGLDYEKS